ncbi:alpha/beta fold hydrolase [Mycetocola zhujimingii]|uniref:Alpha/beta hydrolase n=1 Tax=Mycetocola zhujimingii TaxID=2079792 RepID=A0A2U1TCL0_9MICO|nr:alpha/beta hydrolase [Mycetocola zhujimingii]PWC06625.1 alpha/beta hydrolase [Mycetocola zhujimingii]
MSSVVTTSLNDRVAFDLRGEGPAVIFVAGAGPWREIDPTTTETAELLAQKGCTTVVYDRPGRGESVADGPFTLDRELAALSSLIEHVGGTAVLCGHSSGCSISLLAAIRGLPVAGLALWEAPLAPPDSGAREWADELRALIAAGDNKAALTLYMKDMPPEILEMVASIPAMVPQAPTLQPDADSLVWAESAPLSELLADIRIPVLTMVGTTSYDDVMVPAAEMITAAIPGATWKRMPGAEHSWEPGPMADELARFASQSAR